MNRIERISAAATRSFHDKFLVLDQGLVDRKAAEARKNARGREILVLHQGDPDTLQRMLNAIQPGSYIRPHRHIRPPKAESLILLRGALGFALFEEDGSLAKEGMALLSEKSGALGVDYRAGLWHTFFALEADTVLFEVKPGPYDGITDKEFAPWAPEEGSSEGAEYLSRLEDRFRVFFPSI